MSCDVEFLKVVNSALSGASFDALAFTKFSGWIELSSEAQRYRISWDGWLSAQAQPAYGEDVDAYMFAPVIAPMLERDLEAIVHRDGVYELTFTEGGSVFAGKWPDDQTSDSVLMVTALTADAPFTWGLLD
ncbi:hypothetical protein D3C72_1888300 [compost metagenome]